MMKRILLHGLVAGAIAGIASVAYYQVYAYALMLDFSKVITVPGLLGSCILGTMFAGLGYWVLHRKWGRKSDVWFNALFILLSFATIIGPLSATLPLDVEFPEMFAGATIPMHFFPALFWLATQPLFLPAQPAGRP